MDQLVTCLTELEKLKSVERGLNVGKRKESSAEHSWSCMLIADILLDHLDEPLNRLKVLEYLLYHDVVEVYAGDAKFNNPEEMKHKDEKEKVSMEKILSLMPQPNRYKHIIEEYELRETREAKFAKAVDCIDACIRKLNEDDASKSEGFSETLIRSKYIPHVSQFKLIEDVFEILMDKLKSHNRL